MQEQLITFETAKLAKEKGFNSVGSPYYDNRGNKDGYTPQALLTKDFIKGATFEKTHAVRQSILQKWIREVHGLHIIIDCTANSGDYRVCVFKIQGGEYYNIDNRFTTYEDALETGLQEALKLTP